MELKLGTHADDLKTLDADGLDRLCKWIGARVRNTPKPADSEMEGDGLAKFMESAVA